MSFGGYKKKNLEEQEEKRKRTLELIKQELNLVQCGKKTGNKDYMIIGGGLAEEKELIKLLIFNYEFN